MKTSIKKISIGILAHNEEAVIARTLASLLNQSLFYSNKFKLEVFVVANGCQDKTANSARSIFKNTNSLNSNNIRWEVHELIQPGKSNAWNIYVHRLSSKDSDYLVLLDADIEILEKDALHSMVDLLEKETEAWVSVDSPVKDIFFKTRKSWLDRLSIQVSKLSGRKNQEGMPAWICGQLYCARSHILRRIWLPTNLPCDDAFLYTMVITDGLQDSPVPSRVLLAKSASHIFEAYTEINRLLRHERWLITGSAINQLVYQKLILEKYQSQHAGLMVKDWNEQDPNWLSHCVKNYSKLQGWWLIPPFVLMRRFYSLKQACWYKAILLMPLVFLAFLVDAFLSIQANFALHRGSALGYWGK